MTNQKRFAHEPPPNPFPLSDIRAQLPDLLDYIKATQHSVTISNYGTPVARLVPLSALPPEQPTRSIAVRKLRDDLTATLWQLHTHREPYQITHYRDPIAALLPVDPSDHQETPMTTPALRIAIWNESGGSGKTTIAVEIGYLLAQRTNPATGAPNRVLLIDTDPQGSLTRRLGLMDDPTSPAHRLSTTVGNFLNDPEEAPPVPMTATNFPELHVIPSNNKLSKIDATLLMNDEDIGNLRTLLDQFEGQYDIILIDTPPSRGGLARAALSAVDHILIPVNSSMKSIENFNHVLEVVAQCRRFSPNLKVSAFVVTSYNKTVNHDREVLQILTEHYNAIAPTTSPITNRKAVFNDAMISRTVVPCWKPKDPAVQELNLVTDQLLSIMGATA